MSPIISICIPTNGRVEILRNTLNSIFSQTVSIDKYEVCVSDNSGGEMIKKMLDICFSTQTNLFYQKSNCEGYYNSIEALKLGHGKLLKLQNDSCMIKSNFLSDMIDEVSKYDENTGLFFYSENNGRESKEFGNFNEFMNYIVHKSTWSSAFCIWKKDFYSLNNDIFSLDKMFPHTSLLFELTEKEKFIVLPFVYFENQDVGIKGGYNLPETFIDRYLGMVTMLVENQKITVDTYKKIECNILLFIKSWYYRKINFPNLVCYDFSGLYKLLYEYYGARETVNVYIHYIYYSLKKIIKG